MQVWSLGWEDPLEEGMATYFSILTWRVPWTKEPGGLQSIRLQRVGHDWKQLSIAHRLKVKNPPTDDPLSPVYSPVNCHLLVGIFFQIYTHTQSLWGAFSSYKLIYMFLCGFLVLVNDCMDRFVYIDSFFLSGHWIVFHSTGIPYIIYSMLCGHLVGI